ncbi:MAG: cyclic nucleotide-binding domain-containing protein [Anaerolineae bacterium]|nr:cyclic nucleotide-binding domain-containing protein [Anaerolineae bacterium]
MPIDNKHINLLARIFPGLEPEELISLFNVAEYHAYPAGMMLCQEGNIEDTFYIIIDGKVEITKCLNEHVNLTVNRLQTGSFFGEMSLLEAGPRSATVTTIAPSTLLEIKREAFLTVLQKNSPIAVQILTQIVNRLRDADQRTIVELRMKNEELEKAYRELAQQEKLRSEFLTTVSHELRTPLTAAMGYLQFVTSGMVPLERVPEFTTTVERNLRTVIHLVNNIMFLQELELITPELEPLDIEALVQQAITDKEELAKQNGLTLTYRVKGSAVHGDSLESPIPGLGQSALRPHIIGDADNLGRAISAILDNAIKFSPDGGEIIVEIDRQESAPFPNSAPFRNGALHTNPEIHIAICDPGVGFPIEKLDELFKPFTRIESVGKHLFSGVGLGLPIARHVVQMHGGRIEVQSTPGQGSTFTIILPIQK